MTNCPMQHHIDGVIKRVENNDYPTIGTRLAQHARLFHGICGITTEAGELMDHFKRVTIYGKPLDPVNVKEELGDLLWYVGVVMDNLDITMDDILAANKAKLEKRFPNAFTEHEALARNIDAERAALEAPTPIQGYAAKNGEHHD